MSVGFAEALSRTTIDRIRDRVELAAGQIKNGQTFRPKPGVVVIYNDTFGDYSELIRACFGDLTMWIDRATNASDVGLGGNGVLNGRKKSSVGGVTYRSRMFSTVSLVNPAAAFPINPSWLDGTVYAVDSSGAVSVVREG